VSEYIEKRAANPFTAPHIAPLAKAFGRLQQTTLWLGKASAANPEEAGAAATEYLRMFGLVAIGFMWSRMAEKSFKLNMAGPDEFYAAKIATAQFYMAKILPETGSLMSSIMAGSGPVMGLREDAF
jgi:Acetyl-CoA dehydrogenase C-terminal like